MRLARRFGYFLAPSILQGAASFLMLPVITYVIGPAEYGLFALVTVIVAFGASIASMGGGYLISAYYPSASMDDRRRIVSSLLIAGLAVTLLFVAILLLAGPVTSRGGQLLGGLPPGSLELAAAGMVFGLPWMLAQEVIALEGNPRLFATTTGAQTAAWVVTTLLGLYVFDLGLLSLFLSACVGSLVTGIGGLYTLKAYLSPRLDWQWTRRMLTAGSAGSVGGLLESLQTLLERYLLAGTVGLTQVGLYTHSQQYRGLVMWGVKAASRTAWGPTLEDARDPTGDFARTRAVWDVVFVVVTVLGLLFATLGSEIVGLLTHGRFVQAYPLVAIWMIYLLMVSTGKPQAAILYASGRWKSYVSATIAANLAGTVVLFVAIPRAGLYGAAAALIIQQAILRITLQIQASRSRPGFFQDEWALLGGSLILIALGVSVLFRLRLVGNVALLGLMLGMVVLGASKRLHRVWFTNVNAPRAAVTKG